MHRLVFSLFLGLDIRFSYCSYNLYKYSNLKDAEDNAINLLLGQIYLSSSVISPLLIN